ncbi:MAG: methyltransferase [Actinobacteria bacterium]|nr:MAG: methyltransferase [Actinomycetota bacterium]
MLELFPEGFEERDLADGVELVAYTDAGGEERLWAAFGTVRADTVDAGWEQRWRDFHRPVRIGRVWIGPPWEEPPGDAIAVVIDPGRAFGTGGHATTRLCLELLGELEPGSLLDVGCGSGVLSVAAVRLGFAPVVALDHDRTAVETARRNAEANGVELDVRQANALDDSLPEAAYAVANVSAAFAGQLRLQPGTRALIASGYLESDRPAPAGFRAAERRISDGWAADLFLREE